MSGQQKIESTLEKAGQCFPRTAGKILRFIAWRQIEGVMRYHDFPDAIGKRAKSFLHLEHLPGIDAAAFEGEFPGRINTGNCDFIINVEGRQVFGNILLIDIKPAAEPGINVVQRNIMIPRYNDLRCRQRAQEGAGAFELARPGALRQIARDGDYVGFGVVNRLN